MDMEMLRQGITHSMAVAVMAQVEDDEEVDAGSPARAREHRPHERPLLARLLAGARSLRRALHLLVPRLLLAGEHARFQL